MTEGVCAVADSVDMDLVRRFAGADPDEDDTVLGFCARAAVEWY